MKNEEQFNKTKYKNDFKRQHYVRKEICFKKKEYVEVEEYTQKNNTTLKQIILDNVKKERND